jgi:hypothetical protein
MIEGVYETGLIVVTRTIPVNVLSVDSAGLSASVGSTDGYYESLRDRSTESSRFGREFIMDVLGLSRTYLAPSLFPRSYCLVSLEDQPKL